MSSMISTCKMPQATVQFTLVGDQREQVGEKGVGKETEVA